jgi:hypothetical protein
MTPLPLRLALSVDWPADVPVPPLPALESHLPDWPHQDTPALGWEFIAWTDGALPWRGSLGRATFRTVLDTIIREGLALGALQARPNRLFVDCLALQLVKGAKQ